MIIGIASLVPKLQSSKPKFSENNLARASKASSASGPSAHNVTSAPCGTASDRRLRMSPASASSSPWRIFTFDWKCCTALTMARHGRR